MKTGNNQDYDEFKNWYTNEAPDESELNMVDMAYLAWTQGKAALSQQDAVAVYQRRYKQGVTGWVDIAKEEYEHKAKPDTWEYQTLYTATPSTAQVSRDDILQCLIATQGMSEGVTADAIWSMIKTPEESDNYANLTAGIKAVQDAAQGVEEFIASIANLESANGETVQISDVEQWVRDFLSSHPLDGMVKVPVKMPDHIEAAAAKAAKEYFDRTGGNSIEVIYNAILEAASKGE